ncbi:tail fiber domain-containing protein [uncultured Psychroserpens sp.]|uniref:tail fiber domain-containing protein n=1 Tax=uncultured Psychroserpens sp. TaxID=255436 RepID=UPI0026146351|nr:tail fiber domain-containing protein [uncultured Psychroserpens sp.]
MGFSKKNHEYKKNNRTIVSKTKLTITACLIALVSIAQTGINYKALIKDTNGNAIINQGIDMVFNIEFEGESAYSELQVIVTDNNGIAIATIGTGSAINGDFDTIDWTRGNAELNVQIDFGAGLVDFGNTPFNAVPYALNILNLEGLERVTENGNSGWRLSTSNNANHGPIGINALDFSEQPLPVANSGATGELSVAFGRYSQAIGYSSFAMGDIASAGGEQSFAFGEQSSSPGDFSVSMGFNNLTSGDYSSALGRSNLARGDFSFAVGRSNQISSSSEDAFAFGQSNLINGIGSVAIGMDNSVTQPNSFAFGQNNDISEYGYRSFAFGYGNVNDAPDSFTFGYENIASGSSSIALGFRAQALGATSFAHGNNVTAYSQREIVFGSYNTTYTPQSYGPFETDLNRLFVVANGGYTLGQLIRRNALTILKNGYTGIGTDTPQERLHINGRLRIGTETIEDTGSNQLSFNASLLPDGDDIMRLGNSSNRWVGVWAVDGTINTSDRREKKNIRSLNYGLTEVLLMNPVSFKWKDREDQDTKLGLIAQDLQKLVPEVVISHTWENNKVTGKLTKKESDRLGVYYSDLIPVLIKAIQEQQEIINKQQLDNDLQKAELSELKDNYQSLLSRIEIIESKTSN